jgi:hypothetical protein
MDWVDSLITIGCSILASSGLWTFLQRWDSRKSATTQLLLGLAHEKIIDLGLQYIERGWLTKDEYEDLHKYLWKPYSKFGGNGLAERVMDQISNLPIRPHTSSVVPVEVTTTRNEG